MERFKAPDGQIHAYESDGSQVDMIAAALEAGWPRLSAGEYAVLINPAPSPEAIQARYVAAVQKLVDDLARAWGYDDAKSAVTYAEEPAVPRFQAEGQAIRAWRSLAWERLYAVQAEVQAQLRPVPTLEELLALLPESPARPSGA